MQIFQAVILGVVQGATEFLPVSSSGHLIIIPKLLGLHSQPVVFDTTLHLATAAALLIYFFKDLKGFTAAFLNDFRKEKFDIGKYTADGRLLLLIFIGSIPAGITGLLFEDYFETELRSVSTVALFLILGSSLMYFSQRMVRKAASEETPGVGQAMFIGLFQALALFPGVSRSGATISGGLLSGMSMEKAARFSFYLSLPTVAGAGIFKLISSGSGLLTSDPEVVLIGFLTGFTVGLLTIDLMLKYLKKHGLSIFIVYRLILAGVLFLSAT